jgi:ribosomal-protein-alanine N-acetyltransferase
MNAVPATAKPVKIPTMLKPPPPYGLREMRLGDIWAVIQIENKSFPKPWKARSYEYEITGNKLASYQVLLAQIGDKPSELIGYIGHWLLADEIHISTIAIHPEWRGRNLGELLFLNSLYMAYEYQAPKAILLTLEVRRSNIVAQNLYSKYRLEVVGERKRYYSDGENALLMTVQPLDAEYKTFLKNQWAALYKNLEGG